MANTLSSCSSVNRSGWLSYKHTWFLQFSQSKCLTAIQAHLVPAVQSIKVFDWPTSTLGSCRPVNQSAAIDLQAHLVPVANQCGWPWHGCMRWVWDFTEKEGSSLLLLASQCPHWHLRICSSQDHRGKEHVNLGQNCHVRTHEQSHYKRILNVKKKRKKRKGKGR